MLNEWLSNRNAQRTDLAFQKFCYRPQTKFAKVMFSQVFVCPKGRGVSVVSVQGGLCPRRSLSGVFFGGVSVQGGSLSRQGVSVQGDLCPGRGVSAQGGSLSRRGSLSRGVSVRETPKYGNERAVRILLECILVVYYLVQ